MTHTHDIDTALRTLDAADSHISSGSPRARADLERILATDRSPASKEAHAASPGPSGWRRGGARTTRKAVLAGGVLATAAVGVVVLPALTGGDEAFASWTSTPDGLSAAESADAAASCVDMQKEDSETDVAAALNGSKPAIAERRGVWTTVVLAGAEGFSALCITDDSTRLFAKDWIGSGGTADGSGGVGPRDLVATDLGTGTMEAGDLSLATGIAGSDVVGVVYRSETQGEVAATVSGGHFALWFPGDELTDASSSNPVEVVVTYRDGSMGTRPLSL